MTASCCAGPASAGADAEFMEVRLGMSEAEAFARIDRVAPGAFSGPLCAGNRGVGSYVRHNGLDWQLMAHVEDGEVNQIKLFRFDRSGTETAASCEAHYTRLIQQQGQRSAQTAWEETDDTGERFSLKRRSTATLPDAITVDISVDRLDWDQARCMIQMLISSPSPE